MAYPGIIAADLQGVQMNCQAQRPSAVQTHTACIVPPHVW